MVGTTGPMGSGFPQFGLPRRFAIFISLSALRDAHFPFVPDSITDRNSPNSLDSLTSQEFLDEIGRVFPRGVSAWPYVTKWFLRTPNLTPIFIVISREIHVRVALLDTSQSGVFFPLCCCK